MPFYRCFAVLYIQTHAHIPPPITIQYSRMPALSHYFERMDNVPSLGIAILVATLAVWYFHIGAKRNTDTST